MPYVNEMRFHDYESKEGAPQDGGLSFDPSTYKADKQVKLYTMQHVTSVIHLTIHVLFFASATKRIQQKTTMHYLGIHLRLL